MERESVSGRKRSAINIVALGVILAYFVISSSRTFEHFAPLSTTPSWLYAAAFICGSVLGATVDDVLTIFYGIPVMALIALLVFSAVMVLTTLTSNPLLLDIVLLYALQQSFPRFMFVCALGYVGAFFPLLLKTFFGRL